MSRSIVIAILTIFVVSCGEDRTYQYEQKTARDHWMMEVMQTHYLWGDSIKEEKIAWKDYFAAPATFFAKLTAFAPITDSFSWCEIDTIEEDHHQRGHFNHIDSYGLDFALMTDPTGATSRQYARVITVMPNSPASRAGLHRGDFIGVVDGNRISSSNVSYLENGKARTIVRSVLGVDAAKEELIWESNDTIQLERSERIADASIANLAFYTTIDGDPLVYLQCNKLDFTSSELDNLISSVRDMYPDILVLDLRLCNDGTLESAVNLGSYLLNSSNPELVFAYTIYRDSRSEENSLLNFNSQLLSNRLHLGNIYIVTSNYTCGPAEWLIRALKAADNNNGYITTVGTSTAGQIVMTEAINAPDYYTTINPAVCYVADANLDYDYASGITPDIDLDEFEYVHLYPYGDVREVILRYILMNGEE